MQIMNTTSQQVYAIAPSVEIILCMYLFNVSERIELSENKVLISLCAALSTPLVFLTMLCTEGMVGLFCSCRQCHQGGLQIVCILPLISQKKSFRSS